MVLFSIQSSNTVTRAYSVVSNVITFVNAPANGTSIQVRHIGFVGASSGSGGVTNFYGRTGSVSLKIQMIFLFVILVLQVYLHSLVLLPQQVILYVGGDLYVSDDLTLMKQLFVI